MVIGGASESQRGVVYPGSCLPFEKVSYRITARRFAYLYLLSKVCLPLQKASYLGYQIGVLHLLYRIKLYPVYPPISLQSSISILLLIRQSITLTTILNLPLSLSNPLVPATHLSPSRLSLHPSHTCPPPFPSSLVATQHIPSHHPPIHAPLSTSKPAIKRHASHEHSKPPNPL